MKHSKFPGTHHYTFELVIGINSALSLSPGDISTLFIDALFDLDEAGKLFPGVTVPEDRLQLMSMDPQGYHRFGQRETATTAYQEAIAATAQLPKADRQLRGRLEVTVSELDAVLPHQQMLMAKLRGVMDKCDHAAALADEDRRTAEALLAAARAITATAEAELKSVL